MSLINTATVKCPGCGAPVEFAVAFSVNADRRPDLRDDIIDGSFQAEDCPGCGKSIRMAPELTYLDVARGQWILVRPAGLLQEWSDLENAARQLFEAGYGPQAAGAAREIGARVSARVVFGWPALREKLLCVEHGLDDVTLELLKLSVFRVAAGGPLDDDTELRLLHVEGPTLRFGWISAETEQVKEQIEVPKSAYDAVKADERGWAIARKGVGAGPYVDVNRLLVKAEPVDAGA